MKPRSCNRYVHPPHAVTSLAWARLAAAALTAVAAPLLAPRDAARIALVAGLLWVPWAGVTLVLARKRSRWWRAATLAGDACVLAAGAALQPLPLAAAWGALIAGDLLALVDEEKAAPVLRTRGEQGVDVLLEQMPIALWTTDGDLTVTSWSGGAGWAGPLHGDPVGLPVAGHVFGLTAAHRAALRGEAADRDVRVGGRTYETYMRPLRGAGGTVTGVIGAAVDVTDRKRADEAKTMFLAAASHELKTPLTVIKGFSETLLRAPGQLDPSATNEALQAIARRADELTRMIDRLLLSSRIENGRADINLQPVPPTPIVRERAASIERSSGRRVVVAIDGDVPDVLGDPVALATVVTHLLDNAVKYSPGGHAVRVAIRDRTPDVVVEVTDAGIGMTAEETRRCFERFWQADGTDRRRFSGTGIGLYIVRSLVEGMGGSVHVESRVGRGTRFSVHLRRTEPAPAVVQGDRAGGGAGVEARRAPEEQRSRSTHDGR